MRNNKYAYLHVLQGNYGYGWEDLTQSEIRMEVRQDLKDLKDLKDYKENAPGAYRIIERRELNEEANP